MFVPTPTFRVRLDRDAEGRFVANCIDLDDCKVLGENREDALERVRAAILEELAGMQPQEPDHGYDMPLPPGSEVVEFVP